MFDGEIVALDRDGRPRFNDLLFGRREPSYVAFDVLFVEGGDVRALPLKERKALLEKVVRRYGLQRSDPVLGDGRAAFRAVCGLDLEGLVAKRLADAYEPGRTKWWKIRVSAEAWPGGVVRAAIRTVAFSWQIRLRRRGEREPQFVETREEERKPPCTGPARPPSSVLADTRSDRGCLLSDRVRCPMRSGCDHFLLRHRHCI